MCHVLIIEDDFLLAMDIEALLTSQGATSFGFAATERQAIDQARRQKPKLMTADVRLREGTGPCAVATIIDEHGHIPTIFITATPDECVPCDPPHRVHAKPIQEQDLIRSFRQLAFA